MSGKSKKCTCVSTKRSKKVSTAIKKQKTSSKKAQIAPLVDPWQPNPVDLATICSNDNQNVSNAWIWWSRWAWIWRSSWASPRRARFWWAESVRRIDRSIQQVRLHNRVPLSYRGSLRREDSLLCNEFQFRTLIWCIASYSMFKLSIKLNLWLFWKQFEVVNKVEALAKQCEAAVKQCGAAFCTYRS